MDAAGIVFFPRILAYCHDALAALLEAAHGGYSGLLMQRNVGLPTVHVDVDFMAPLRFGDTARIELLVARIGRRSVTFEISLSRVRDETRVARVRLICACSALVPRLHATEWPPDVRQILEAHLVMSA